MQAVDYIAKVSEYTKLTEKYHLIFLELFDPHRIEFKAGQFLSLKVLGEEQRRSYSITSPPAKNHGVELLVDIGPQGVGTRYLVSLKPGDEVEFLAPLGKFMMVEVGVPVARGGKTEEELVFVATGCGVSPIRSMILDLLETKKDKRPIKLLWGLRYVDDMFWEEDFRKLAEFYSNFEVDITLSKPPEDWPLCSGRVTDCIGKHEFNFGKSGFYLCGNREMIEEMRRLLSGKGVQPSNIHYEKFY